MEAHRESRYSSHATAQQELDELLAPADIEEAKVNAGDRGVVVQTFEHPDPAVMVEYADREGQTRAPVIYSPELARLHEVIPEAVQPTTC